MSTQDEPPPLTREMFSSSQYNKCLAALQDPKAVILSSREMTDLCARFRGCCVCGNPDAPHCIFPGDRLFAPKALRLPICNRHWRRQQTRRLLLLVVLLFGCFSPIMMDWIWVATSSPLDALHGKNHMPEGYLWFLMIVSVAVLSVVFQWGRLHIVREIGPVYVLQFSDPARQAEVKRCAIDVPRLLLESDSIERLISIYRSHPQGFDRWTASKQAEEIQSIGEALNRAGGMALMLRVHQDFRSRCGIGGAPRNLEFMWDGIGDWRG